MAGWSPGGLASPLPGAPWLQLALPLGPRRRDPSARARHRPAWDPSGSPPVQPTSLQPRRGIWAPLHPPAWRLPAAPSLPSGARHLRPGVGSAPLAGRSGAAHARRRPPARPRRPHSPSALFVTSGVAAACTARRSTPRPGAHSSGPGPGTRGSSARRAWRAPARRARSAGPRARSRAPGGGGAKQAARPEAALDKGHAHCLSLPRSGGEEGGDPGPVNGSKVEEG